MIATKEEILSMLTELLVNDFEIPSENIRLEAELYNELDLDSIDTVDLLIRLSEITGEKITPESFKEVRTVSDVVEALSLLIPSQKTVSSTKFILSVNPNASVESVALKDKKSS
jgi:acyl carrier protein